MYPPQIIHMVWFGHLPCDYEINVVRWASLHREFQINLYVNQDVELLRHKFASLVNLTVIHYLDIYCDAADDLYLNLEYLNAELTLTGGNLAAASDIFRLDVLYQLGGYYFDTDIYCKQPIVPIDLTYGFQFNTRGGAVKKHTGDGTCNDIIIAHKNTDFLRQVRALVHSEYQSAKVEASNLALFFVSKRNSHPRLMKMLVHLMSGAGPLGRVATSIAKQGDNYYDEMDKMMLSARLLKCLLIEKHNTWLPSGQEAMLSRQAAMQQAALTFQRMYRQRAIG